MSNIRNLALAAALLMVTGLTAYSQVDVLYVAQPQGTTTLLTTYDVNPQSAVATQVGTYLTVGASNIDPLTVNGKHFIYVWSDADVWVYATNAEGVPENQARQHLSFNFAHFVTNFLVDPDGKFAYAGMIWVDAKGSNKASVVLFTIDPATGKLTNTGETVAQYGPDPYTGLTGFSFGASGRRLYASYFDNGPYTCIIGYDYYPVNQSTGKLGARTLLFHAQADCSGAGANAVTDKLTASAQACCGSGSGGVDVNQTFTSQFIGCEYTPAFCADPVASLNLDPANANLFFGDANAVQTFVAHLDFAGGQLVESGTIPGLPKIYFSPDSRVVYSVDGSAMTIYAFQSSSGTLGASTSISVGNGTIATTTLR